MRVSAIALPLPNVPKIGHPDEGPAQRGRAQSLHGPGNLFGPIRKPEKNYPVEVHMGYDDAGRVTVTARDGRTGESVEQQFSKNGDSDLSDTYKRLQQVQVKY